MLREMEIWVKCKSFRAFWSVVQMWQHTSSDFPMVKVAQSGGCAI